MSCVEQIIGLIESLAKGVLFATKDCLNFGLRNAVDKALSRLVKIGYIMRIARGVFVRPDSPLIVYDVRDIAAFKAAVFNKTIATHGADLAHRFGLVDEASKEAVFYVGGCSSSFDSIVQRVYFKRASAKRIAAGEKTVGALIRALWHLRLPEPTDAVRKAIVCLPESEQRVLMRSAHLMPGWLTTQVRSLLSAA
ncbi:MAG: DUF6088 family protein [Candidatus Obscuribacterales bacterium]